MIASKELGLYEAMLGQRVSIHTDKHEQPGSSAEAESDIIYTAITVGIAQRISLKPMDLAGASSQHSTWGLPIFLCCDLLMDLALGFWTFRSLNEVSRVAS